MTTLIHRLHASCLAVALAFLAGCATHAPATAPAPKNASAFPPVAMDGDWLTVGGEKFLVLAVGYESYSRPGQAPWKKKFEPAVMREDFKRIKAAGFNTIRTWQPMSDEELDIAAEFGLWVIQGLWIKVDVDFNDEAFRQETYDFYETEVSRSAKHPNILFYMLLNEPHGDAVYRAGIDSMNDFYTEMVRVAKHCDPKRLFTYSNCVATDFMVPTMWDLTAQNVYPYSPTVIDRALGYRGYLECVKRDLAPRKPLIITEYGLSVSPNGDGRGYGGNTLAQQRDGVVRMNDDWLAAGAAGGCVFMWSDGWWKDGHEDLHDPGPEEWYGLLECDSSYLGRPRPVYYALQEYNKAVRTLPRDGEHVGKTVDVEVWAPDAKRVQYRIDDEEWKDLKREGAWWWRKTAHLGGITNGSHYIWTREVNPDGAPASTKSAVIVADSSGRLDREFLHVHFAGLPATIGTKDRLDVAVDVTDADGKPVAGKKIRIERFLNTGWDERGADVETDAAGRATYSFPPLNVSGIVSVAVGTIYNDGLLEKHYGDLQHVEMVEGK